MKTLFVLTIGVICLGLVGGAMQEFTSSDIEADDNTAETGGTSGSNSEPENTISHSDEVLEKKHPTAYKLRKMEQKIQEVKQKLEEISGNVEDHLQSSTEKISNHEKDVKVKINGPYADLMSVDEELNSKITDTHKYAESKVKEIQEEADSIRSAYNSIKELFTALETSVDEVTTSVHSKLGELNEHIEGKITDVEQEETDELSNIKRLLQEKSDYISSELEAVEQSVDKMGGEKTSVTNLLTAVRNLADDNEQSSATRIQEISRSSESAIRSLNDIHTKDIQTLEEKLAGLTNDQTLKYAESSVATLDSAIESVNDQLDALEQYVTYVDYYLTKFAYIYNNEFAACPSDFIYESSAHFCIKEVKSSQYFWDAELSCKYMAQGGRLAVIDTEAKRVAAAKHVTGHDRVWVGAARRHPDHNDFVWFTGASVGSQYWHHGEPNDAYPGEPYAEMFQGRMNDLPSSHTRWSLCEVPMY